MIMRKADRNTESGALPSKELIAAVGRYNDEMVKAGVLVEGEWLKASSKGTRINISGGKFTVTDGPFAEAKELIIGFVIIQVNTKEEAIEWAQRCPTLDGCLDGEIEIREVYDASDFPADVLPALTSHASATVVRDAEKLLRAELTAKP
jgi:hypothetical protein